MNKIFRYYNQNRKQVWITVIIVIFIITVIQIFNSFYAENSKNVNSNTLYQNDIEEKYVKESKSLVNGGEIHGNTKEKYGDLIDNFLKNCINEQYDEAYEVLSSDCKNELYPSKEIFVDKYCLSKFKKGKTYDFQLWATNNNIYLVKIHDDILAGGRASSKNYIQDYYTIKEENDNLKLNISSYIGLVNRNKSAEKDDIKIVVDYSKLYMDYEIYTLTIKNNSGRDIMLDSKQETDSTIIMDNNNYKYEALVFENLDEDLIIKANEEKEVTIKFSNNYNDGISMKSLVFLKIIKDYNDYLANKNNYNDYMEIEVAL